MKDLKALQHQIPPQSHIYIYMYIYIYIGAKAISERRIEHDHGFLRTGKMVMMMLIMNILIMHMTRIMDMMMFLILMLWMLSMTMLFTDEQNCQTSIGKRVISAHASIFFI